MLDGTWPDSDRDPPTLELTDANDGWYPMANGLSRLATPGVDAPPAGSEAGDEQAGSQA